MSMLFDYIVGVYKQWLEEPETTKF